MAKAKTKELTIEERIEQHNSDIVTLLDEKELLLAQEKEEQLKDLEAKKLDYEQAVVDARIKHNVDLTKQEKAEKVYQLKVEIANGSNRALHIAELNLRQVQHAIDNA